MNWGLKEWVGATHSQVYYVLKAAVAWKKYKEEEW